MIEQLIKHFQSQSRAKINQHQENSIDEFLTEKETIVDCSKAETKRLQNLSTEKS